uniref:hypothetical protein n=1 Tax=Clostridium sp. NkU-1 TaxID=1095009 RepID=UPI00326105BF
MGIPARQVYTPRWLIVMIIMHGWRCLWKEGGIFWEPVSRKKCWIRGGLPMPPPGHYWYTPEPFLTIPAIRRRNVWARKIYWSIIMEPQPMP